MKALPVHRRTGAGVLIALAGLLSTLLTVVVAPPTAAHAAYGCDNVPQGDDSDIVENSWDADEQKYGKHLIVYWLRWWEPTFRPGGVATDGNDTDFSQTKTITVTESRTYTVKTTHKATAKSTVKFLGITLETSYEFSQELTDAHTTSNSVAYTDTLGPHVAKRLYNFVQAVNVRFDMATWFLDGGRCWYRPSLSQNNVAMTVPTTHEFQHVKQLPTVNPDGVVDAVEYNHNIRPCETVALFGNGFEPPNRVVVRQNGRTWYLGAGSPWWYESSGQINATLPCDLQPNGYASISVESNKTFERTDGLWPRFVYISP